MNVLVSNRQHDLRRPGDFGESMQHVDSFGQIVKAMSKTLASGNGLYCSFESEILGFNASYVTYDFSV